MNNALLAAEKDGHSVGLMIMDIDEFKKVNDLKGHEMGDILLIEYSKRITNLISEEMVVGRLGGDEFLILMPIVHRMSEAVELAEKLLQSLQEPWELKEDKFKTTSSIGISVYPKHGVSINELMKRADEGLYEAKSAGRNLYKIYRNS